MQAAFILLLGATIATIAWLLAWWHTRTPVDHGVRDELRRLKNHALWLEQRLDTARRERWDPAMIVTLSDQLGAACRQLARARQHAARRSLAGVSRNR